MIGLLEDTIHVADSVGLDDAGEASLFGDPRMVRARVELSTRLVRMPGGEEQNTTHKVLTAEEIAGDARVWLPGEDPKNEEAARDVLMRKSAKRGTRFAQETWL